MYQGVVFLTYQECFTGDERQRYVFFILESNDAIKTIIIKIYKFWILGPKIICPGVNSLSSSRNSCLHQIYLKGCRFKANSTEIWHAWIIGPRAKNGVGPDLWRHTPGNWPWAQTCRYSNCIALWSYFHIQKRNQGDLDMHAQPQPTPGLTSRAIFAFFITLTQYKLTKHLAS